MSLKLAAFRSDLFSQNERKVKGEEEMRIPCGTILAAVFVAAGAVDAEAIGGRKLVDYVDPFIVDEGVGPLSL